MRAMILAAGPGTRLGELGRAEPKALIEVGGRPLLERHLDFLASQGIERVVVNAHHLAPRLVAFVDAYRGPLDVRCIVEPTLLGTAGAVRNALEDLLPGPFLVLYGDVVLREELAPLFEHHGHHRPAATIAVYVAASAQGKGVVETTGDGQVAEFREKPDGARRPVLINAGVYVVEPSLLEPLPSGEFADFGHDVFPAALSAGAAIDAVTLRFPVIDVGTPAGLALARALPWS
jgi:mannose-1-phosphate guanylyltransferase